MALYVYAGKIVKRGSGFLSTGVTATVLVDPPGMNAPVTSSGSMTISWVIPTRTEDGTTPIPANNAITSFNLYYTPSSNPPTQAKSGGTGATSVTGISASSTSRQVSVSTNDYWVAMETVNGLGAGNLSEAIFVSVP